MKKLDLKAYAKINLSLDVLGTRPDGYHEIATVMQMIDFYDELCVRWLPDNGNGITIRVGTNKRFLPRDERNLAYKAAKLLMDRFDVENRFGSGTVSIDIKKRIPVGAGLGGGSADAAAVLSALDKIWGLDISIAEMCGIGAILGADVPFFVMGHSGSKCALAEGTGTELTGLPGIDCWAVLSKPPMYISTAEVYKGFDVIKKDFKRPDTQGLINAIKNREYLHIGENIINVLENYSLKVYPVIARTKNSILETSPAAAAMSGSGPTVFGLYEDRKEAEAAYKKLAELNKETFLTKTISGCSAVW